MKPKLIARVAVDVRLYFDVPVSSQNEKRIKQAAKKELERVAIDERIQVMQLHYPNIYLADDWSGLSEGNFYLCDITPADQVSSETRFPL